MLCKLSLSNIKKSFKDYAIYFVTLILAVCIFYIFNSIDSQTAMLTVTSRTGEMIQLLTEVLSYVSIFVSFILGFLIIYASRFLIKKRNKEFGIYMILGMSKKKISIVLLIETVLIGLISLAIGLVLGVVLSQITSIFIANLFEADMTRFTFSFSQSAMLKTILYYSIIYLIVMIFNTIIVNKNKLINLLQASKKQEKIKIRNPIISILLFLISIAMLGFAYYSVTDGFGIVFYNVAESIGIPIALGTLGTILFFYSVAGMLLRILSKCHRLYYKKLNAFIFKQISSKINTMVISISIICIMLFFTLCLLSSALSIKNYFNNSINKYAPVDFQVTGFYVEDHKDIDIKKDLIEKDNILKNNTKDILIISEYEDPKFTLAASFGNYLDDLMTEYPYLLTTNLVNIMSESDYNKMADLLNLEKTSLAEDEYTIVANFETDIYKEVINRNSIMNIFGKDLKSNKKLINGFDSISSTESNIGFFVVDDSIIKEENKKLQVLYGKYSTDDKELKKIMDNIILNYTPDYTVEKKTKGDIKDASIGLSVIITFIALYLGVIFLISSSAILSLKELSDCIDDKNKYKVLRQIGTDEKEINKSLFKQTLIFFAMPLLLAIVHTIFGLKFCSSILNSIGVNVSSTGPIVTFFILLAIYGMYFIVTYLCNKNIIKEKM